MDSHRQKREQIPDVQADKKDDQESFRQTFK
jgi:hypothetical protein